MSCCARLERSGRDPTSPVVPADGSSAQAGGAPKLLSAPRAVRVSGAYFSFPMESIGESQSHRSSTGPARRFLPFGQWLTSAAGSLPYVPRGATAELQIG